MDKKICEDTVGESDGLRSVSFLLFTSISSINLGTTKCISSIRITHRLTLHLDLERRRHLVTAAASAPIQTPAAPPNPSQVPTSLIPFHH